jgi:hypothetical protein
MKSIAIVTFIFLLCSPFAYAGQPDIPDTTNIDIWEILDRALNWFFGIALSVAAIMLVYAGFTYVTASGNEEKIKTATKTLIFALIGVAIALLAKGLPMLVQDFLLGNNSTSQNNNIPSDNITSPDPLANTDFSSIKGGSIPNPDCPPDNPSCACKYDSNASGDTFPCGSAVGGVGNKAYALL